VVHTRGPALRGDVQLQLAHVDVGLDRVRLSSWHARSDVLSASLVDFHNKRISLTCSEAQYIIDYPLLEGQSARIRTIDPADFNDQSEGILAHFCVLVADPLAGKLCELLVVPSNHDLERLVHQVLAAFNE